MLNSLRPRYFVQLLQQTEVELVKGALKRLLFLTLLAGHMASRRRTLPFPTNEESPAKASKCRALGRHPTAAPVPELEILVRSSPLTDLLEPLVPGRFRAGCKENAPRWAAMLLLERGRSSCAVYYVT